MKPKRFRCPVCVMTRCMKYKPNEDGYPGTYDCDYCNSSITFNQHKEWKRRTKMHPKKWGDRESL